MLVKTRMLLPGTIDIIIMDLGSDGPMPMLGGLVLKKVKPV